MHLLLLICLVLIVIILYRKLIKPLYYWKDRGVPYQKPWPFFGNMTSTVFRQKSMFQQTIDLYNGFPDERYNGIFQFMKPMLLIRDLDLLKQIMIKDFDHFVDHNAAFVEHDPLMSRHLFALKGQQWRDMRATLSPSFTSSKMRYMFGLMLECVERFSSHLEAKASPLFVAELRDLYCRFTNDAIASVVFGYNCDSLANPDNEFFTLGKQATNFSGFQLLKFFLLNISPNLAKKLGLTFFPGNFTNFFRKVVKENIEKRKLNGIIRPDMIQLLLDASSGRPKYTTETSDSTINEGFSAVEESQLEGVKAKPSAIVTPNDITAQAFIFFVAGFDAVATLLCFISYELAVNVDVQEKLQAQIDQTLQENDGKVTYNAVLGLKYLDMVVSETLRKWGIGFQSDRVCVKDYEIKPANPNEKPFTIEKGTVLYIPVCGIMMDPKLYPNPEKFDPERFSDENKHNVQQLAYLPFGAGPRNCIASRFALLESKALIFHLLSKFTITVVDKTPIPLVLSKKKFSLVPDEGFWVGFKLRKPL